MTRSPADYYRAKTLQEDLLKAGPVPYSIVRAAQFMEFVDAILSWTADDETVRLPRTPLQPVAAADVAATVADVAAGAPWAASSTWPGPTCTRWTNWAGSPSPPRATGAR